MDTKPHYALLDGLRGVAALLVVWYHILKDMLSPGDNRRSSKSWVFSSGFSLYFQVS